MMLREAKLQVELVPNPNCRLYHTNFKMCENRIGQMIEGHLLESERKQIETSSEAMKKLAYGVQGILGVLTWNFHTYQLQVVKAPLFDWNEIEPQITGLIQMVGAEITGQEVTLLEPPINVYKEQSLGIKLLESERDFMDDFLDDGR